DPHRGAPGVQLHGPTSRTDLWWKMGAVAAVLCPAKWDEPFGLVAAEALAAGTAVVAYASGNLAKMIVSGGTGIVVPVGAVDAAAEAVRRIHEIDAGTC